MAVGFRAAGTFEIFTTSGSVSIPIPLGGLEGDRVIVFATWKPQSNTLAISTSPSKTDIGEFADGVVASGNGVGSMRVAAWYFDIPAGGYSQSIGYTVGGTGTSIGGFVGLIFSKSAGETWNTPSMVSGAITNWTTTSQVVSASATATVPSSGVVASLAGLRDDSATITRPTNGVDDAGGLVTWNGNFVATPTRLSTTTGDDVAASSGYRLVTTGASGVTLRQTATISAAETGAALWIVQGVSGGGGGATEDPPAYIGGGYYG